MSKQPLRGSKRLNELKESDKNIQERIRMSQQNIVSMKRMIQKEEKEVVMLWEQRNGFSTELLELQAEHDYINDTNCEKLLNKLKP